MGMLARVRWCLLAIWWVGCSDSFIPDGRFLCISERDCPDDFECVNQRCFRHGRSPEPGGPREAGSEQPGEAGSDDRDTGVLPEGDASQSLPDAGEMDAGPSDGGGEVDAGPCSSPAECDDKDPCTTDTCQDQACQHAAVDTCCNRDEQCEDNSPCSRNICSASMHRCESFKIEGCCVDAADCPAVPCNAAACGADQTCKYEPRPSCCTANTDCDDRNACTTDSCEPGGLCKNAKIANCCLSPGDCNDGNACTTDSCSNSNRCEFTAIAECCTNNAQCADNSACTTESCNLTTQRCTRGVKLCDDHDLCTTDACDPASGTCTWTPMFCAGGCCQLGACRPITQCNSCSACGPECCVEGACLPPYQCKSTE